jgi:hypothetical protein
MDMSAERSPRPERKPTVSTPTVSIPVPIRAPFHEPGPVFTEIRAARREHRLRTVAIIAGVSAVVMAYLAALVALG